MKTKASFTVIAMFVIVLWYKLLRYDPYSAKYFC